MARRSSSSRGEETVNHYGLIRLRVNGAGNLRMTLYSLDKVESDVQTPLVLQSLTNIEPTVLSNFTQQRSKLQIKTTGIGETFQISKIIIFVKPVAKSLPQ
jgi:hypothetical protein